MKSTSALLLCLFLGSGSLLSVAGAAPVPNLLLILTEDQGAQLGSNGTAGLLTPHMDALAASGVYFSNAFVPYPVCSASKAALLTGLHSHTNGLLNNTVNYHKSAAALTPAELKNPLYLKNRIHADLPTLVERLHDAGYYQGVSHKLHVVPNEKFPYDEFLQSNSRQAVRQFIARAREAGKPWHLFYNIPQSHRPYPDSAKVKIRVDPSQVQVPGFLPDTPLVRRDWAEYLAGIEIADRFVGEALSALRESGQDKNTIIIFLGDHGPTFQHGKMTLYDLGLRTPLIIRLPGRTGGFRTDALVSSLDLTPTLLDLLDLPLLPQTHGLSLRPLLEQKPAAQGHAFIFAEISHRGPLPNQGMQERSVCDGRWKLIYREKLTPPWRQVQADSKEPTPWGNRTYDETVRTKDQFPEAWRILTEMDPQSLGGTVPALELYDLRSDPDEMENRAADPACRAERTRLYEALREWVKTTNDPAVTPPAVPPS